MPSKKLRFLGFFKEKNMGERLYDALSIKLKCAKVALIKNEKYKIQFLTQMELSHIKTCFFHLPSIPYITLRNYKIHNFLEFLWSKPRRILAVLL